MQDYYLMKKNMSKNYNAVTKPEHYTNKGWIEPIDFISSNDLWFLEWNVIKYVFRYKDKNWLEDLNKAKFYLQKLIDRG